MTHDRLRAKDLKVGDEFILYGVERKVFKIEDGRIHYKFLSATAWKSLDTISAKSKQWIEVICKNITSDP